MKSITTLVLYSAILCFSINAQEEEIIRSFDQITDKLVDENGSVSLEYIKELKEAGKDKDLKAQIVLGDYYLSIGPSNEKNYKQAVKYYKKAAKNNDPAAMYRLAYLYDKGLGTKANVEKAEEWLQASADANYHIAQFDYGKLLLERNELQEAQIYLQSAYDQRFYEAAKLLGDLYSDGVRTTPLLTEAISWYDKCTYCQYQMKVLRKKVNTYEKLKVALKENPDYLVGIDPTIDLQEIGGLKQFHEQLDQNRYALGKKTLTALNTETVGLFLSKNYRFAAHNYDFLTSFQQTLYQHDFLHETATKEGYFQKIHKQVIFLIGFKSPQKVKDYYQKMVAYAPDLANDVQVQFLEYQLKRNSKDLTALSQLLTSEDWLADKRLEYLVKVEELALNQSDFLTYQSLEDYLSLIKERKQVYRTAERELIGDALFLDFANKLKADFKVNHYLEIKKNEWFEEMDDNQQALLTVAKEQENNYRVYAAQGQYKIHFIDRHGKERFSIGEEPSNYVNLAKKKEKEPVKEPTINKVNKVLSHQLAFIDNPLIFTQHAVYNYNGQEIDLIDLKEATFEQLLSNNNVLAQKQNQYGIVDKKGNLLLSFAFDKIIELENQSLLGIKKDSTFLFDAMGRMEAALPYSVENPIVLFADAKSYLLNIGTTVYELIDPRTGDKSVFEKDKHRLHTFTESGQRQGFFVFKKGDNKVGIKSLTGQFVMDPNAHYEDIYPMNAELVFCVFAMDAFPENAFPKANTGRLFSLDQQDFLSDFHTISLVLSEELLVCEDDFGRFYTLNANNEQVRFGEANIKQALSNSQFLIEEASGQGIVNKDGSDFIAAKFPQIYIDHQAVQRYNIFGLNFPSEQEQKGLFDSLGNVVLKPFFDEIYLYDSLIRMEIFSDKSILPDSTEFAYCDWTGKVVYQSAAFPSYGAEFITHRAINKPIYFDCVAGSYVGKDNNGIAEGYAVLNASKDFSGHYTKEQVPYTYSGEFNKGKKHGQGNEQYADKNTFVGNFKNGYYENGVWKINETKSYSGAFKNGFFDGVGKYKNDYYQYDGQWKWGKKHGLGTEVYRNLITIDGKWNNNQYDGLMTFTFWDQSKVLLEFKEGLPIEMERFEQEVQEKLKESPLFLEKNLSNLYEETQKRNHEICEKTVDIYLETNNFQLAHLKVTGPENTVITSIEPTIEEGKTGQTFAFKIDSEECIQGVYYFTFNQEYPISNFFNRKEEVSLDGKSENYGLFLEQNRISLK